MHSHRRWFLVIAIFLAAASSQASAGTISDYLALTDQAGKTLKQPGGEAASDTLTEEDETAAANANKVAGIIVKVDIPNIYPQGVFPRSGVNLIEANGTVSDTIEQMVVTMTPHTITFQVTMFSDGNKSNGAPVLPLPLVGLNITDLKNAEGAVRDLTPLLFPMFYNPDGSEKGLGPSPFRDKVGSDLETALTIPEPSSLILALTGLVGVLGYSRRLARGSSAHRRGQGWPACLPLGRQQNG
jgi:hypothetical protein